MFPAQFLGNPLPPQQLNVRGPVCLQQGARPSLLSSFAAAKAHGNLAMAPYSGETVAAMPMTKSSATVDSSSKDAITSPNVTMNGQTSWIVDSKDAAQMSLQRGFGGMAQTPSSSPLGLPDYHRHYTSPQQASVPASLPPPHQQQQSQPQSLEQQRFGYEKQQQPDQQHGPMRQHHEWRLPKPGEQRRHYQTAASPHHVDPFATRVFPDASPSSGLTLSQQQQPRPHSFQKTQQFADRSSPKDFIMRYPSYQVPSSATPQRDSVYSATSGVPQIGTRVEPPAGCCDVCWDGVSRGTVPQWHGMMTCSGCGLLVHRCCYGLQWFPVRSAEKDSYWLCSVCEYWQGRGFKIGPVPDKPAPTATISLNTDEGLADTQEDDDEAPHVSARATPPRVYCSLCLRPGGAMRLGPEGLWVHVACVIYCVEGPYFALASRLQRPVLIRRYLGLHALQGFACSICRGTHGFTLRCGYPNCHERVHVPCAFFSDLRPKLELVSSRRSSQGAMQGTGRLVKVVVCAAHASPSCRSQITRHQAHLMDIAEELDADWPTRLSSSRQHKRHGRESTTCPSESTGLPDQRSSSLSTGGNLRTLEHPPALSQQQANVTRRRWGTPSPPVSKESSNGTKINADGPRGTAATEHWMGDSSRKLREGLTSASVRHQLSQSSNGSVAVTGGRQVPVGGRRRPLYPSSHGPVRSGGNSGQFHQTKLTKNPNKSTTGSGTLSWPDSRSSGRRNDEASYGGKGTSRQSKQLAGVTRKKLSTPARAATTVPQDDDEDEEVFIEEDEDDDDDEPRSIVSSRQRKRTFRDKTENAAYSLSGRRGRARVRRVGRPSSSTWSDTEERLGSAAHVAAGSHVIQRGVRLKWERYELLFKRQRLRLASTSTHRLEELDDAPTESNGEPSLSTLARFIKGTIDTAASLDSPPFPPGTGDVVALARLLRQSVHEQTAATLCLSLIDGFPERQLAILGAWKTSIMNADAETSGPSNLQLRLSNPLKKLQESITSLWPAATKTCRTTSSCAPPLARYSAGYSDNVWETPVFASLWDATVEMYPELPVLVVLGDWLSRLPAWSEKDTDAETVLLPSGDDVRSSKAALTSSSSLNPKKRRRTTDGPLDNTVSLEELSQFLVPHSQAAVSVSMELRTKPLPVSRMISALCVLDGLLTLQQCDYMMLSPYQLTFLTRGHKHLPCGASADDDLSFVRACVGETNDAGSTSAEPILKVSADKLMSLWTSLQESSTCGGVSSTTSSSATASVGSFVLKDAASSAETLTCRHAGGKQGSMIDFRKFLDCAFRKMEGDEPEAIALSKEKRQCRDVSQGFPECSIRVVVPAKGAALLPSLLMADEGVASAGEGGGGSRIAGSSTNHVAVPGPTLPVLPSLTLASSTSSERVPSPQQAQLRNSRSSDGLDAAFGALAVPVPAKKYATLGQVSWDLYLGKQLAALTEDVSGSGTTGLIVTPRSKWDDINDFVTAQRAFFMSLWHHITTKLHASQRAYLDALLEEEEVPDRISEVPTLLASVNSLFLMASHWGRVSSHMVWGCTDQPDPDFVVIPTISNAAAAASQTECAGVAPGSYLQQQTGTPAAVLPLALPPGLSELNVSDAARALIRPFSNTAAAAEVVPVFAVGVGRTKTCSVCFGGEWDSGNPIITCIRCCASVHRGCYGIGETIGEEDGDPYYCLRCAFEKKRAAPGIHSFTPGSIRCELCNTLGGALKRTTTGRWVHITCAVLLLPETIPREIKSLDTWDLSNIAPWRYESPCSICLVDGRSEPLDGATTTSTTFFLDCYPQRLSEKSPYLPICHCVPDARGVCLRCSFPECTRTFHPMCAWLSGMYIEILRSNDTFYPWASGTDQLFFPELRVSMFCFDHTPKDARATTSFPPVARIPPALRSTSYQRCLRHRRFVNRDLYPHLFSDSKRASKSTVLSRKDSLRSQLDTTAAASTEDTKPSYQGCHSALEHSPQKESGTGNGATASSTTLENRVFFYGPDKLETVCTSGDTLSQRLLASLAVPKPPNLTTFPDKYCDQYCAVCLCRSDKATAHTGSFVDEAWMLLRCRRCGLSVHKSCYGASYASRERLRRWLGLPASADIPTDSTSVTTSCGADSDPEGPEESGTESLFLPAVKEEHLLSSAKREVDSKAGKQHDSSETSSSPLEDILQTCIDDVRQPRLLKKCVDVERSFTCEVCSSATSVDDLSCLLCSRRGGALKQAVLRLDWSPLMEHPELWFDDKEVPSGNGGHRDTHTSSPTSTAIAYVHATCASFCPGVTVGSNDALQPILGLERVILSQFYGAHTCALCHISRGVCIPCTWPGCHTMMHPLCAQHNGLILEQRLDSAQKISLVAYCQMHSQRRNVASDTATVSPLDVLDQLRLGLEKSRLATAELKKRVEDKGTEAGHLFDLLQAQQPLVTTMAARYGTTLPGRVFDGTTGYGLPFVPMTTSTPSSESETASWRFASASELLKALRSLGRTHPILKAHYSTSARSPFMVQRLQYSKAYTELALKDMTIPTALSAPGLAGVGVTASGTTISSTVTVKATSTANGKDMSTVFDPQQQQLQQKGLTARSLSDTLGSREDLSALPPYTSMSVEELEAAAQIRELKPIELIDVARLLLPEYHRRRRGRPSAKERLVRSLVIGAVKHNQVAGNVPTDITTETPFFQEAIVLAEQCGKSLQSILCGSGSNVSGTTPGSSNGGFRTSIAMMSTLRRSRQPFSASDSVSKDDYFEHDSNLPVEDRFIEVELSEQRSDVTTNEDPTATPVDDSLWDETHLAGSVAGAPNFGDDDDDEGEADGVPVVTSDSDAEFPDVGTSEEPVSVVPVDDDNPPMLSETCPGQETSTTSHKFSDHMILENRTSVKPLKFASPAAVSDEASDNGGDAGGQEFMTPVDEENKIVVSADDEDEERQQPYFCTIQDVSGCTVKEEESSLLVDDPSCPAETTSEQRRESALCITSEPLVPGGNDEHTTHKEESPILDDDNDNNDNDDDDKREKKTTTMEDATGLTEPSFTCSEDTTVPQPERDFAPSIEVETTIENSRASSSSSDEDLSVATTQQEDDVGVAVPSSHGSLQQQQQLLVQEQERQHNDSVAPACVIESRPTPGPLSAVVTARTGGGQDDTAETAVPQQRPQTRKSRQRTTAARKETRRTRSSSVCDDSPLSASSPPPTEESSSSAVSTVSSSLQRVPPDVVASTEPKEELPLVMSFKKPSVSGVIPAVSLTLYDSVLGMCCPSFPFPNCPWYGAIPDSAPPLPPPLRSVDTAAPSSATNARSSYAYATVHVDKPTTEGWHFPLLRADGPVGSEATRVITAIGLFTYVPQCSPRFSRFCETEGSENGSVTVRQAQMNCRLLRALNQFRASCNTASVPLLAFLFVEPTNRQLFSQTYATALAMEFVTEDAIHTAFTQRWQKPSCFRRLEAVLPSTDGVGANGVSNKDDAASSHQTTTLWDCFSHLALPSGKAHRATNRTMVEESSLSQHRIDLIMSSLKTMFHRLVDQSMAVVSEIEKLGPIARWDARHPVWDGLLWVDVLAVGQEIRLFDVDTLTWVHALVVSFDAAHPAPLSAHNESWDSVTPSRAEDLASVCIDGAPVVGGKSAERAVLPFVKDDPLQHRYLVFFLDTETPLCEDVVLDAKAGRFEWRDIRTRELVEFRTGNPCWLQCLLQLDAQVHVRSLLFLEHHLDLTHVAMKDDAQAKRRQDSPPSSEYPLALLQRPLKCSRCFKQLLQHDRYVLCRMCCVLIGWMLLSIGNVVREAPVLPPVSLPPPLIRRRPSCKQTTTSSATVSAAAAATPDDARRGVSTLPSPPRLPRLSVCLGCYCLACLTATTQQHNMSTTETPTPETLWSAVTASPDWACPRCVGTLNEEEEERAPPPRPLTVTRRKRRASTQSGPWLRSSKRKRKGDRHK